MATTIIANIIRELRRDRGIARKDIAVALGVNPSFITMIEKHEESLGDDRLDALAKLHGGYSGAEILAMKYLERLERDRGVDPKILLAVLSKSILGSSDFKAAQSH